MLPKVLTKDFLTENREQVFKFVQWYSDFEKEKHTQVSIEVFFDLDFTIQLGFYLEWLGYNGITIVNRYNPINKSLMLKIVYQLNPNLEFHYHDLDEVDTNHFKHNPLEAYELLIAMFINRLNFPF